MMSEKGHSFSAEKKAKARIGGTDRVRGKNCELKGSSQNKSKQKKPFRTNCPWLLTLD